MTQKDLSIIASAAVKHLDCDTIGELANEFAKKYGEATRSAFVDALWHNV